MELIRSFLQALPNKKALLTGALIIGVVVLVLGIALVWALFPLLVHTIEYVDANGIKGVLDAVLPYAERLWKGNG